MKDTQTKPPYSMTSWLTSRENACKLRVTEGIGPGITVAQYGGTLRRIGMWEPETEARRYLVVGRALMDPM